MRVTASGTTEPQQFIRLIAKMSGEIVALPIQEGQPVRQGDLLIKFDDRELKLARTDARGRFLKAQSEFGIWNFSRNQQNQIPAVNLSDPDPAATAWQVAQDQYVAGQLSDSLYQMAKVTFETANLKTGKNNRDVAEAATGLLQARTALEQTELHLSYGEIRAPFSGLIGDLKVNRFQYILAGQECCELLDLAVVKVAVGVLEHEVGWLKPGRQASVTLPALPGVTFKGQIISINPRVDAESKTCRVTVQLPNPGYRLKAGMFAEVKLDARIFQHRFLVPKSAVLLRDNRKLVFIVRENLAKWCYVETGLENEELVEILESKFDLKPGELVITEGHYTLVHDAPVKIVGAE
jgi:RND family efflux transporter MFP subunit